MGQNDCLCIGLHKEVNIYILNASKGVSKYVSFDVFEEARAMF